MEVVDLTQVQRALPPVCSAYDLRTKAKQNLRKLGESALDGAGHSGGSSRGIVTCDAQRPRKTCATAAVASCLGLGVYQE